MKSKNKRLQETTLRRIARLLREAKDEKEEGQDSIDSQIDSFFSDYEAESRNSKNEGKDFRMLVRRFLIEAEEDEEKKEDEDKEKDKEKDEKKDEEKESAEPKKLTIDDINVDTFADSVVRLIDNYDSLLEIRNAILRRSVNFLLKSYSPDVAEAYKTSLEERHGLESGKSKYDEDEDFQPPPADRAGAALGS